MMAQNDKLIFVILIMVFVPKCGCAVVGRPSGQQQQDFFVNEDSFANRATTGTGTGIDLGPAFPILSLLFIVPLLALVGASTTTRVAPAIVPQSIVMSVPPAIVTCPPAEASTTTTSAPCVPTNCPPGYMMLTGENAGTNCYLYSGENTKKSWDEAMSACAMTPGAFLWNPNTKAEVSAVRDKFSLPANVCLWVGGKKDSNGKFVFEIDDTGFVLEQKTIPYGVNGALLDTEGILIDPNGECLGINPVSNLVDNETTFWTWGPQACSFAATYVCEFPRKTCP
ncbi:uncharacterized protein LOC134698085 [Mytilus trossulus]|uniref:uncharacterized protein LOC134698085 n=1 Tax=Mytilus trossulus TaxID=6551 RepID=UPI003005DFA6